MSTRPVSSWRDAFERQAAELLRLLPAAFAGDADAVHRARVASRRVREHLAIVAGVAPSHRHRKLVRRFRRITRLLGPARELDVGLTLLDGIAGGHPRLTPELQRLKSAFAATRHERLRHAANTAKAYDATRMNRKLRKMLDRIDTAWDWREAAVVHLKRRGSRLVERMDAADSVYEAGRLHAVRIAVKRLRYSVEIVAQASRRSAGRELAVLKAAQDTLGRMHDLHVLAEPLRRGVVGDVRRRTAVVDIIDREIRSEHGRYLDRCDRLRAVVSRLDAMSLTTPGRGATRRLCAEAPGQARSPNGRGA